MRAVVWKATASTCLAAATLVAVGAGWTGSAIASAPEAVGTVCVSEPYQWFGEVPLAPGESFGTGVVVAEEAGTQLAVTAVDHSTGSVVTDVLVVRVGSDNAVAGASVTGGEIGATNTGAEALIVTSIAMNIDRCHQVESAAPLPAVRVAAPADIAPTQPEVAGQPTALPWTGATSASLVFVALGCTVGGLILRRLSRRRPALS